MNVTDYPSRVLCVDDDPALCNVFFSTLKRKQDQNDSTEGEDTLFPFDVSISMDADDAVAQVQQSLQEKKPFSVAFIDVRLPYNIEGIDAAERIRSLDPFINIVMVTAYSDISPEKMVERIPPRDKLLYIRKPLHPHEIKHFAATLCAKWQAEKELHESRAALHAEVKVRTDQLAVETDERLQSEEELRKKEQFLSSVFDAIQDGIVVLSTDMTILEVNSYMVRIYQYAMPIVGKKCYQVFHDRDKPCEICPVKKTLKTGRLQSIHTPYKMPDGQDGFFELFTFPIFDENNEITGVVEYARDITEKIKNEEDLRLSHVFMEAVNDVVIVIDIDTGMVLESNAQVESMFGYTKTEICGMTVGDLSEGLPPYSQDDVIAVLHQTNEGEVGLFEWRARKKNGQVFWVEVNEKQITYNGHRCVIATIRDVSKRKETEQELLRIREALDDCGDAVVVIDKNMQITYINMAFGALFGYARDQLAEICFKGIFTDATQADQVLQHVLAGEQYVDEVKLLGRDNREFAALLRGTPVLNECYDVAAVLFILNDITERRQLEAQLLHAQNMKSIGQLAAGIAHEINTPMQYVFDNMRFLQDGFSDIMRAMESYHILLDTAKTDSITDTLLTEIEMMESVTDINYLREEIPHAINESLEGAERVTEIVRAMRQFTHPGSTEKTYIDINQALLSTITVARNEWRYVANLETDFDPDLPQIPCYPNELNQVILNLTVNAAHAIEDAVIPEQGEKGLIKVSTRRDTPWVIISIQDTGTGIPEDIQKHIFEPFFTTKDVGHGTGQGLAISHAVVVEKHGGTLTFETTPGEGSTFFVRLPLEDTQKKVTSAEEDTV